jgi:hypothetical protein
MESIEVGMAFLMWLRPLVAMPGLVCIQKMMNGLSRLQKSQMKTAESPSSSESRAGAASLARSVFEEFVALNLQ